MSLDMTRGAPLSLIVRFSVPMLIGGVFQQFYNIIDMLIVGKVNGSRDLAAIGATASGMFFILSVTLGVTVAFSIVVARHFGANNRRRVRRAFATAAYITAACAVLMAAAGVFGARPLLVLLKTPPEIIDAAALYMRICVGGSAGLLVYNGAAAVLRGIGDSRTPLYFLILSSLLNVVLDLLFVAGLGMGVKGVAVATVISQCVSAFVCVWYMLRKYPFFRPSGSPFVPDRENAAAILRIGLLMGVQVLFLTAGDMVVARLVNSFGADAVAAYATGSRVVDMVALLSFLLADSFAVYVGQNLGARQVERIESGFRSVFAITLAVSVVSGIVVILFGGVLVRWFIAAGDPHLDDIVRTAVGMLRVYGAFFPFLGLILLYNKTIRGMGLVLMPFLSGVMELVGKIGLSFLLAEWYGLHGLWFAVPIGWVTGIVPVLWEYHRRAWVGLAGTKPAPDSVRHPSDRFVL